MGYDLVGNMTSESDGTGVTASYSFSAAGEVTGITSSLADATHPGSLVSNVQNGPFGRLTFNLGNGLMQVNHYDNMGRTTWVQLCGAVTNGCQTNQLYGFSVGWTGNRIWGSNDTIVIKHRVYGYDEFDRLTSLAISPIPGGPHNISARGSRSAQHCSASRQTPG